MKYSQIRIALLTFTFGFASVPFFDFAQTKWVVPSIDLPDANSETLVITPRTEQQIGFIAGSACGVEVLPESVVPKKKRLKSNR